ncbi:MAG: Alginate biosynthesis transcriptional regulatory protein AlgB [Planctomycetes bacterium]|nr:Alginate biosynthesis transcriptional regulatory protein AlgB [Planctomycetota bacterium]
MTFAHADVGRGLHALVVDDDRNIRTTLAACLEAVGCRVRAAETGAAAVDAVAAEPFDLAFLDLRLAEESGLDVLPRLLAARPGLLVVIITAFGQVDTAVEAMKRGAWDYVAKPFKPAQVRHVVNQALERRVLSARIVDLEQRVAEGVPQDDLTTESQRMRAALETAFQAADSQATVLLRGESGTGKGVVARAIHARSPRRTGPFTVVNCPTLAGELLTGELFGHAKGAYTGAVTDQPGRVEAADGGTLFLDEIAEVPPPLQAKLLRFVQERQFERVGESRTRSADVRIVAATNRDLDAEVRAGRFREDLLYRLNVIEIALPPLREREEDVVRLAHGFLAFFARAAKRRAQELSAEAAAACRRYPWPGNVRELRNAMERISILWPAQVVELGALPERIREAATGSAPRRVSLGGDHTMKEIEREHFERVLARASSQAEAARILGIDVTTVWRTKKRLETD